MSTHLPLECLLKALQAGVDDLHQPVEAHQFLTEYCRGQATSAWGWRMAADAGETLSGSSQAAVGCAKVWKQKVAGCAGRSMLAGTCTRGPMLHETSACVRNFAPDACCLAVTNSTSAVIWLQESLALDGCTASTPCNIDADYLWANELSGRRLPGPSMPNAGKLLLHHHTSHHCCCSECKPPIAADLYSLEVKMPRQAPFLLTSIHTFIVVHRVLVPHSLNVKHACEALIDVSCQLRQHCVPTLATCCSCTACRQTPRHTKCCCYYCGQEPVGQAPKMQR